MSLLTATGIVAGYGSQDEILKGVDLGVGKGEIVAIIGPNGAGKSTLLRLLAPEIVPNVLAFDSRGLKLENSRPAANLEACPAPRIPGGIARPPPAATLAGSSARCSSSPPSPAPAFSLAFVCSAPPGESRSA